MSKSLGIFVTTKESFPHVLGITQAAKNKGAKVKVFFTWIATHLTQHPDFKKLCEIADDVSICADSYKKQGFNPQVIPPGLTEKKMATQAQHGVIIEDYDCYLSL